MFLQNLKAVQGCSPKTQRSGGEFFGSNNNEWNNLVKGGVPAKLV